MFNEAALAMRRLCRSRRESRCFRVEPAKRVTRPFCARLAPASPVSIEHGSQRNKELKCYQHPQLLL